jgi:hypothetical protein
MPRRRLTAKARRPDFAELTIDLRRELQCGRPFFGPVCQDLEELADAWEIHRDTILPAFIAANPAQRPFAWWATEYPEELHRFFEVAERFKTGNRHDGLEL